MAEGRKILVILSKDSAMSTFAISKKTGMTWFSTFKLLIELEARGKIERVVSGKANYWRLVK